MTRRPSRAIVVTTTAVVAFAGAWMAAQQVRDVPAAPAVGNATVSGTVVTEEAQPRPLRHATVSLAGDTLGGSREAVTDDHGAFVFSGLAAGRYALSASKPAWLTTYYGSHHPGHPAYGQTPLVLRDGEHVELTLGLVHGGVISGRVIDPNGRPIDATVVLLEARTVDGQRVLAEPVSASSFARCDDRGIYRFYGLEPGSYVVLTDPPFEDAGESLYQMTPEQWQAAQHPPASGANAANADENRQGPSVTFAPVYYPGAVDVADATPVTIGPGEEKDDIDFVLKLVPTARVSGVIAAPDGQPPVGPIVTLQSKAIASGGDGFLLPVSDTYVAVRVERDGTFAANAVPPGEYTILVRAQDRSAALPAGGRATGAGPLRGGGPFLSAMQDISVAGQDLSGLTLTLQPGTTVSGHVVADSSVTTSFDRWIVRALPDRQGQRAFGPPPATPDATGSFSMVGVAPGRWVLMVAQAPAGRAGRGTRAAAPAPASDTLSTPAVVESATVHGHDALDLPFEVHPGESIQDAEIHLVSHLGEISGVLRNAAGQPAAGYIIVVFAADRAYWTTTNRRMPQPSSTDRDGAYRVADLPAGEYLVAAATDLDPDSLHDADVLAALAAHATPVTLASGEKKTQNFTIGSGGS